MGEAEWWRGAVIYEVYLQSFCDGNADGIGDLPGLLSRLDYVASLGVDAIWITPFYRSPMADCGYDVSDYRAVDRRYGTLADFDAVVARAKALGLRVLIDQVWSHTSIEHPWFAESRSSRDNEKADWFVWADPRADGGPPNNWLSAFGGPAWKWEPARRQYYLHHFLPDQPKLDLTNERVLEAHFANAEFWLRRGMDGFRFDAVDFMLHDDALRDNPPDPIASPTAWNPFRLQRHIHDMCQPTSQVLMSRIRRFTDGFPDCATIGEMSSEVGALGRIANMTGSTKLHMAYTLGVMKSAFGAAMIRGAIEEAAVLNHTGWLCWGFSNHDVDRVATRWNPSGKEPQRFAQLLLALLACLPGSVCLYQGEELGLPNARLPLEAIRDPFGLAFLPAYRGARRRAYANALDRGRSSSGIHPSRDGLAADTRVPRRFGGRPTRGRQQIHARLLSPSSRLAQAASRAAPRRARDDRLARAGGRMAPALSTRLCHRVLQSLRPSGERAAERSCVI